MQALCGGTCQRPVVAAGGSRRQGAARLCSSAQAQHASGLTRREILLTTISAPVLTISRPAGAEDGKPSTSSSTGLLEINYDDIPFVEDEFTFQPPKGYKYIETNPIVSPERRGPAPERSPVRARFDAQDGAATISIVVRGANSIKPMLLQVTDITAFGTLEQTASLLVPRGSTLLAATSLTMPVPPRQTKLGKVEFPDRTYYRYEFLLPNGLHVAMSVAARAGKVFVCGASAPKDKWAQYGPALAQSAASFKLREKEDDAA